MKSWMMERYLRLLPTPGGMRKTWIYPKYGEALSHPAFWEPTRHSLALGIASGWSLGLLPIFGFHGALVLRWAAWARCHIPSAVLGTHIANPFTIPAILVLQYIIGNRVCSVWHFNPRVASQSGAFLAHYGLRVLIGSLLTSLLAGICGYLLVSLFLAWKEKRLLNEVV